MASARKHASSAGVERYASSTRAFERRAQAGVEEARYRGLRGTQRTHDVRAADSLAGLNCGQSLIIQVGLGASLLFAAQAVRAGEMTAGEFVACQLYVLELFRPLSMLGSSYSMLVGAATATLRAA